MIYLALEDVGCAMVPGSTIATGPGTIFVLPAGQAIAPVPPDFCTFDNWTSVKSFKDEAELNAYKLPIAFVELLEMEKSLEGDPIEFYVMRNPHGRRREATIYEEYVTKEEADRRLAHLRAKHDDYWYFVKKADLVGRREW